MSTVWLHFPALTVLHYANQVLLSLSMAHLSTFNAGRRLAQSWVNDLTHDERSASDIRRDACARLRRMRILDAMAFLPDTRGLDPEVFKRAMHAGFLAGLHASLHALFGSSLEMTAAISTEVGYTMAYLGILNAPDEHRMARGDLMKHTLRAIGRFVDDCPNPMVHAVARANLWSSFYRGVARGLYDAVDDLGPSLGLHLKPLRCTG